MIASTPIPGFAKGIPGPPGCVRPSTAQADADLGVTLSLSKRGAHSGPLRFLTRKPARCEKR